MSQEVAFSIIKGTLWVIAIAIWALFIIKQRKMTLRAEETARIARENLQIMQEIRRQ